MEWKTIESAPKDGTVILITDGKEPECAFWAEYGCWQCTFYDGYGYSHFNDEPTHWMPLPPPPLTKDQPL